MPITCTEHFLRSNLYLMIYYIVYYLLYIIWYIYPIIYYIVKNPCHHNNLSNDLLYITRSAVCIIITERDTCVDGENPFPLGNGFPFYAACVSAEISTVAGWPIERDCSGQHGFWWEANWPSTERHETCACYKTCIAVASSYYYILIIFSWNFWGMGP